MPLSNYTDLKAAIADWLKKGTTYDAVIPDFVRLAESRLNKVLDDPEMEVSGTITLTSGVGALPADFGTFVSVNDSTYGRTEQVTASQFSDFTPSSGNPSVFTVTAGSIRTAPAGSGTLNVIYRRSVPALASNATNWLLTRAPECYLYGSLLAAEVYGWNDERAPLIKAAYDEAIRELRADGDKRKWGAAPLAPRLART